ncbi:MAG: homocysteine S-methyltransferase family protein [Bacillota bacterium]
MTFNELLNKKKVVMFDGGMGTMLAKRGCDTSGLSNLNTPEAVTGIHREYGNTGADVLITNTFTMNRISLESKGLAIDVEEVNSTGVKLARQAAEKKQLIFGDIGPTGQLLEPYGTYTEEQFYDNYVEKAAILTEQGVDGLIIETFTDLREAVCALKACRDKSHLPFILSLAFSTTKKGGRTIMGSSVEEAAKAAEEYGAVAVGANCGDLDPLGMAEITEIFKKNTSLPVIIQPNAGKPKLSGGETIYDMQPAEYAEGVIKCVENGASILGGCCGTTPEHLAAVASKVANI